MDTTAPGVTTRTPTGAVAARNTLVTATFSESMDAASVEAPGAVVLGLLDSRGRTTPVAAGVSYDPGTKKVTLDPAARLVRGATYGATVRTVAKDEAGNALVRAKTWRFTVTERQAAEPSRSLEGDGGAALEAEGFAGLVGGGGLPVEHGG